MASIYDTYYATLIEGVSLARYHLLPLKFRASQQYTFRAPHFDFRTLLILPFDSILKFEIYSLDFQFHWVLF